MSYQVKLTSAARKEVQSLPAFVRAQALQSFKALADTPRLPRSKELRGKPGIYRVWLAGRWRIVYEIDDDAQSSWILYRLGGEFKEGILPLKLPFQTVKLEC